MKKKYNRNWLERKLDEYNHTMELIRTVLAFYYFNSSNLYYYESNITIS